MSKEPKKAVQSDSELTDLEKLKVKWLGDAHATYKEP